MDAKAQHSAGTVRTLTKEDQGKDADVGLTRGRFQVRRQISVLKMHAGIVAREGIRHGIAMVTTNIYYIEAWILTLASSFTFVIIMFVRLEGWKCSVLMM